MRIWIVFNVIPIAVILAIIGLAMFVCAGDACHFRLPHEYR